MNEEQKKGLLKRLENLAEKRADYLVTAYDGFFDEVKKAQDFLAREFYSEFVESIELRDGKIVNSAASIRKVTNSKVIAYYGKTYGQRFVDYIIDAFKTIVETAAAYISELFGGKKEIKPGIILTAYGIENDKLIKGGYLESLLLDNTAEREIKRLAVKAITAGQSLSQFRGEFTNFVKGGELTGVVESQFRRAGFDAFAGFDRALNNEVAKEAGLNFAIYNGSRLRTSRPFCAARKGKVFSRAEILSWQKLDWQGKKKDHQILTDLGGYQCVDVLNWITDELAEQLK